MKLFCVGLSHHTANVETREQFGMNQETECLLREKGCAEALVLTTCNRVEVYGASAEQVATETIMQCLARNAAADISAEPSSFYRYENRDCARHLFRVVSGLDSMVVGETEVLGQAKRAYESARTSGGAGGYLHRLFQRAFRVAKQVRTHTSITRGTVSVGSVAVDLAARIFGDLGQCSVLVLGAGETSERTARALVSRGVTNLLVSNRSIERAHELVRQIGGSVLPFEDWPAYCDRVDIVICSTAAEQPLIVADEFEAKLRHRVDRPLFVIDIAVPRNVDPRVNDLEGVYLYDIDALQSVADQALALRRDQVTAAEEIISAHLKEFDEMLARRDQRTSSEIPQPGMRTAEQG